MAVKKGLGKGLDALFFDNKTEVSSNEGQSLKLSEIEPNRNQPRKAFDEEPLAQLADSIKEHGLIQPLLVRPLESGGYQIVAGERRWRASRMAGLTEVPVIIRDIDDLQATEIALIENLQRENLNAIEEALGYQDLMENYHLTQAEVSKSVGKSRSAIANTLRLLNLPKKVMEYVSEGKLSSGHARTLLAIDDSERLCCLAQKAIEQGMSVRELEKLSHKAHKSDLENSEIIAGEGVENSKKPTIDEGSSAISALKEPGLPSFTDSYYAEVELSLTCEMGRNVKVKLNEKGNGTITFDFYDKADLEKLIKEISTNDRY